MRRFEHTDATTIDEALGVLRADWTARIIAGGTDLLGEMKAGIIPPSLLVNLKTIPGLAEIHADDGSLHIGPLVTLTAIASDSIIGERVPILSQASASAASPQLRNMGTLGGNLCQRPRCWYYRGEFPCLRKGGRRCYSVRGDNRYHAILGGGPCFIVHPSDTAPALMALDAELTIQGPEASRLVSIHDFFVGPRTDPHHENILQPNEVLTSIRIPAPESGARGLYLKMRERQSWAFALVSIATQLVMDGSRCLKARIVLGGVAPVPWRSKPAEQAIEGKVLSDDVIHNAAQAALAEAKPMSNNGYKIAMAQALVRRALANLRNPACGPGGKG